MKITSKKFHEIILSFKNDDSVKILSLDCFDTLLWRLVNKPSDIFFLLNQSLSAAARSKAENNARKKKLLLTGSTEVNLRDIYNETSLYLTDEDTSVLINNELDIEKKYSHTFEPAIELLIEAKKRNIRTIIVSDTYFEKKQLQDLLFNANPKLNELIDDIYCSADYGCGKTSGLWNKVIARENVPANSIFHAGDNEYADFIQPTKLGVNAIHFIQNSDAALNVLQNRRLAANVLFSQYENKSIALSLHHSTYSIFLDETATSNKIVGYTTLGPILNLFSKYIYNESRKHKNVKIAFLMRDGYMPKLAFDAIYPHENTFNLRISRLTSIRASFTSRACIENHLIDCMISPEIIEKKVINNKKLVDTLFSHFNLTDKTRKYLLSQALQPSISVRQFFNLITSPRIVDEIISISTSFRQRLKNHITKITNIKENDTLLLVDLGYSGTTQNKLSSILEEELKIIIRGCYLIVGETPNWDSNRCGLINPRDHDWRIISTLTNHIASFEMLCSSNDKSVIDYDHDGNYLGDHIESELNEDIINIQKHAIDFVKLNINKEVDINDPLVRDGVAIDLARFIYFPSMDEINLFEKINFEINLGSNQKVALIDNEKAILHSRKYGISSITEGFSGELRTNYPSELRYLSIENAISLITSYRYGLTYPINKSMLRKSTVDVLFIIGQERINHTFESTSTYDGFYSLYIPLLDAETIILIGKTSSRIELLEISQLTEKHILSINEEIYTTHLKINHDYFVDGADYNEGFISQATHSSFIYVRNIFKKENSVLRLVYRPL